MKVIFLGLIIILSKSIAAKPSYEIVGLERYPYAYKIMINLSSIYGAKISKRFDREVVFTMSNKTNFQASFRANPELGDSIVSSDFNGKVIIVFSETLLESLNPLPGTFLAIACHEIGHGVAGGKKDKRKYLKSLEQRRTFIEGKADYFVAKCMKGYLRRFGSPSEMPIIDNDTSTVCNQANEDGFTCNYILQSFKNFAIRESLEISYLTRSRETVFFSDSFHPAPQCRIDTVKASYFKNKRPRCWHSLLPTKY
jgi:hypothetical protein